MEEKVSVGLLGLGVVGSGVIHLIEDHQEKLAHQLGCKVEVDKVLVRNIEKARNIDVDQSLLTTNPDDVLENPNIDLVIEVMGGIDHTKEYILKAFSNKKHVVSANKDLVAVHGPELQAAAVKNNCDFYYEASVAGGIPILRGINEGLSSDHIQKIMGIVNGTTNYILTKMDEEGVSYEDALADAQQLGFAEADPTSDVEGLDAARKMAILGRLAFSTPVDLQDVEVEGIHGIELKDLRYAAQLGYTMKLIGFANFFDHELEVSVEPTLLAKNHPLASVKNEYNAVYVYGEAVGETMFYGPGAGSLPTATAILSDVIAAIKAMRLGVSGKQLNDMQFPKTLRPKEKQHGQYYVRLCVEDKTGVFSEISSIFHEQDISFQRILQTPVDEKDSAEIVLVTHDTPYSHFEEVLNQLKSFDAVNEIKSYYKVEGDA
ncbi:homoserine dehydrogenase [Oceanobacillus oncorhynchi subsp. incaldanensis]|uniref:Homoserine dehydrogenase n=1 Tax=Oceanobacillus oncorhynchi TaxID=545501 RepID=A0A0A1MRM8_9BACI|nr:homoserine dehydrogenase [Oceanobacillus oncorhynchi]MDM8100303.1 homoserine dehydrogenase [Oceanobacillus oncorhynchi]UUI40884.1 homoserine dehydrogenase [Oceanobacillus oncorhynchi]GIO18748.1 homoserine dehydrogenase [Oceanobacillus oncorhynchi subsp. incaldanensis]CEI82324.1 Homoserine dehydrogenase [Oceanobacillus oncorhynchi]